MSAPDVGGLEPNPIGVTFFYSYAADRKREESLAAPALAARIRNTTQHTKESLPWLKLARFGDQKTDRGSFRSDNNMLAITGIEADYDGEEMSFEEARQRLANAGVSAILYTSPSHTPAKPRWRILCPLSSEYSPSERNRFMGRLNGLFGGIFSDESWTLSQSYYFGSIKRNKDHQVVVLGGTPLDKADHLDAGWIGKPNTKTATGNGGDHSQGPVDTAALLRAIRDGHSYHRPMVRLIGRWAITGTSMLDARTMLLDAMDSVFPPDRDQRWQQRNADIDRCLADIYGKHAEQRAKRLPPGAEEDEPPDTARPPPEDPRDDVPPPEDESQRGIAWPEPLGFFLAQDNEPPELLPRHVPVPIWVFAKDAAERMGVDPTTVALCGLVSCAAVINDDWCIQPRRLDTTWTENARLWGAIVGDPSVLKTPVVSLCTRPVDHLDADAREYHQNQMRHYKKQLGEWRKDKEAGEEPRPPKLSRYLVEGATVEALSEVLRDDDEGRQQAPSGKVLARHDEMGEFFGNLDRYNAGGRGGGDRGAYLRLYNGGRYTIDRIMRGSFAIPNWSACVLGGIQPAVIQKIARFTDDDGLLQRFLYAVPGYQLPGIDRRPDGAALARYQSLFPRLAALHPPRHPDEGRSVVVLHTEAHKHREDIDAIARAMAALPDTSSRLRACFGKWAGQFARLCLTAHLIEYVDDLRTGTAPPNLEVVPEATARMVACLMRDVLLPHLLRADAVMFSSAQTGHAGWIAGHILANEMTRITARDVVRAYGQLRSPEDRDELAAVMASLVTVGWLEPMAPTNSAKPVSTWLVNPRVHTLFAEHARRHRDRQEKAREQVAADMETVRSRRGTPEPGDLP